MSAADALLTEASRKRGFFVGDYAGAADQFQVWNKGGRPLQNMPGLTARRAGEADIYTSGIYTNHN